jgi:ABC-type transporter Mla subunit MlaD
MSPLKNIRRMSVRDHLPGNRIASRAPGPVFVTGLAVTAILIAVVITFISFNAPNRIPGRSYYDLEAEFANADNIAKHYSVRLGGRQVGQVLSPHVDNGKAVVKLRLDKDMQPLRSDTTLAVRPRSLIGVRFVEIIPGSKGRELKPGERIPASQTRGTEQLDSVLDTFDTKTRLNARTTAIELGKGIAGRGESLGATAEASPELFDALRDTAATVNNLRPGAFGRLTRGAGSAAAAADPVRDDIAQGFRPEADALKPFVDRREAVHSLLEQAPATFSQGAPDLAATTPVLTALNRFARSAGQTLRPAPEALAATSRTLKDARPGLRDAESALKLLDRAVDPTLKLLDTVDRVRDPLNHTIAGATPHLLELGPRRCDFRLIDNWADITERGTVGGNFLHFNIIPSVESLSGRDPARGLSGQIRENPYPAPCGSATQGKPELYPGHVGPEPLPKGRP